MQRFVLAAVLLLALALFAGCAPVQAPQSSLGAKMPAPDAPPIALPDAAGDWQRIRENGRLVVGTAADYAPFESYDQAFQLGGYDIALLRAIGAQLGVEVQFKDFAFEGLPDALQLGQIDVAAAALTVTPERAAVVDFSQPYFASTEGILARKGSAGAVTSLADLAGRRIGVERGSIYESSLRRDLIESGLSPAKNLILYTTIEAAASDLAAGRIDLVITDLAAAESVAKANDLQIAGSGLSAQQYALGVRKGAGELRAQLDTALAALAANGTLARLAADELGLAPDQLTAPGDLPEYATESGAAMTARSCIDGLARLEDLSLPDLGMTAPAVLIPGQPFTKAWRVLNTGTCTWDDSYQLVFAYGSPAGAGMGGQPTFVRGTVPPGESYDIELQLVAPVSAGIYQGVWQMQNGRSRGFGERLRVGIQVAGAPTPTPAPTQTPAPGITFAADAKRVLQGNAVNFTWDVQSAQEVYFYQAGQEWQNRAVAAQGSAADIPSATTTYNLRVLRNGQEDVRSITVYVEPNPDLPQFEYFTLAPAGELPLGDCVTLAWKVTGAVDQTAVFRNKEPLWSEAPVEGTYEDCPKAPGTIEYAVGAQGPGGRNYAVATLQVVETPAAAKRTPQAGEVQGLKIDQFSVLPEQLAAGGCVELHWAVAGETTNIRIERSGITLVEGAPRSGAGTDCPAHPGSLRYQIMAIDEQGRTDSMEVSVSVEAPEATALPLPSAAESAPTATSAPEAAPGTTLGVTPAASAETPVGNEYVLVSFRDAAGALASPLTGTRITARFGEEGQLSGEGGCNSYSSTYQLNGNQLAIAPIAPPEEYCSTPIGVMDQEQQYLSTLQTAAAYSLKAGMLSLSDGAGNEVAVFVPTK
ncbi:MAG: transporter substrate-binding domain-containing protein [Caldilineaceae bacterium]